MFSSRSQILHTWNMLNYIYHNFLPIVGEGPIHIFHSDLLVADLNPTFSMLLLLLGFASKHCSLQDIDIYHRIWINTLGNLGSNSQILSVKCPTTFWWCPGIPTVQKSGQPFDMENLSCLQSGWRRVSSIHIFGLVDLELKLDFPGLHRLREGDHPNKYPLKTTLQQKPERS